MRDMNRYALVNEDNYVLNVLWWDEQTPWSPPSGIRVIKDDNVSRGDMYDPITNTFIKGKG